MKYLDIPGGFIGEKSTSINVMARHLTSRYLNKGWLKSTLSHGMAAP